MLRLLAAAACMLLTLMQAPALAAIPDIADSATEVDLIFAHEAAAVEKYGDWVYGWASSYASAYRIGGRLLISLVRDPADFASNIAPTIEGFFYEQLRERVLTPERNAKRLVDVIERQADARLFTASRQLAQRACAAGDEPCLRRQLARLQPMQEAVLQELKSVDVRNANQFAAEKLFDIAADQNAAVLRTTRPIATRVALFLLRATEFASVLTIVTIAMRSVAMPVTSVTTAAVMFVAAWGVDYLIHSVDASINRSAYTAGIQLKVERTRPGILEFVNRTQDRIDAEFLALASAHGGERSWQ